MGRFYYFMTSRKEVPRKSWLDPQFPRNPKLKWILKRLPLDRGYFKVYFFKRGKFSNNLVSHIYLSTRNMSFYFKSCSHCHAFCCVELSRNSLLLINNPSKRGNVETLARSSVSPSPQVNMKFKLTASR